MPGKKMRDIDSEANHTGLKLHREPDLSAKSGRASAERLLSPQPCLTADRDGMDVFRYS